MLLALLLASSETSASHVLLKAFDVVLGQPSGDLRKRGFRPNEFASDSWVRTDDTLFSRVTVSVSPYRNLVTNVTALREYDLGDRDERERACLADLRTVSSNLKQKYPTLAKSFWWKSEDGMSGMLGYYRKEVLSELDNPRIRLSRARYVSVYCIGTSILPRDDNPNKRTLLFVSYTISDSERVPINSYFRVKEKARERDRARSLGIDASKL